ncbi:MAG TPA: mechanosensitive ion channel family protein [Azospirillaceae bacterium]|nr:mechanosensitive ion channel family protein [Azospirillaceae bacterium]
MARRRSHLFREIALPFVLTIALGLIFHYSGEAYQAIGLEALDKGQKIASYALGIGLFLSAAILVERLTRHVILDTVVATALGGPVPRLLSQLSGLLIYLVAFAAILAVIFKQDLTVLWAASGVAGIVLGMALRELLLDIFCGLALNVDRPVKIGDYVQLHRSGDIIIEGQILEISWRTTRIQDLCFNVIVVPNNRLSSATITNFSQPANFLEASVIIPLDVNVPPERAMRILLAAATEAASLFNQGGEPAPYISIRAITPHAVEYFVYYYADLGRRARGRNLILQHVLQHLRQAGLRPAMPKLEQTAGHAEIQRADLPTDDQMRRIIGASELFVDLTETDLAFLVGRVRFQVVPADHTIVNAGEAGTSAFIVVEGLLQATHNRARDPGAATALLRPGDVFGAAAALLGDAHSASVRSRTSAMLCEVDLETFQDLFVQGPDVPGKVSRRVAEMMAREMERTARSRTMSVSLEDLSADVLRTMRRNFASSAMIPR